MAEKIPSTILRDLIAANDEYVHILLEDDVSVECFNKSTKKIRYMPFKALYENNNCFWLQGGSWEYLLDNEVLAAIEERLALLKFITEAGARKAGQSETETKKPEPPEEKESRGAAPSGGYGKEYDAIAAMTDPERVQVVNDGKKLLDSLVARKHADSKVVTEALVDTTRDAALINHTSLMDAMSMADNEAKIHTQALVNSTCDLVRSSSRLVSANIFNDELMSTLVKRSNGTIIQHMTRVYLNGLAFLSYYNKLVSTSSIINKLRISFDKKYKKYYHSLLPRMGELFNLEGVFIGGMRAIPEKYYINWATGFLIHDIGKAAAVEYHEGEGAYNRDIVVEHVKVGYTSIMNKTNYPRDAGLITGYHHEYYGDPVGYGYFRIHLEQQKKTNPSVRQNHCISYELKEMLGYEALAYFPAKVLEIIDVYDSVTDPNRKYRKALTPEEALAMMREEFLEKYHKIDPILFDMFSDFVRENQKR